MRRPFRLGCAAAIACLATSVAYGQVEPADETVTESTEITTFDLSRRDISSPILLEDAVPQATGTIDFRLRWEYVTESSGPAFDTDDDIGIGMKLVWGPCKNVEFSLDLPINLGDGGRTGADGDGNADLSVGLLYRFWDEQDWVPAFALSSTIRTPTGSRSSGVDAELRGVLTKTLVGDLRGHMNAFLATVNGNNDPDARHFQWGFVWGVDFPLTEAKDLWMMLDYMHRSSKHEHASNMNILEAALEWEFTQGQSMHFSTQVGLDDNEDTPNWGAKISYTYQLAYK